MNLKSVLIDTDPYSNLYRTDLAAEIADSTYINLANWRKAPLKNLKIIKGLLADLRSSEKNVVIFSFGAKNNLITGILFKLIGRVKFVPTVNGLGRYATSGESLSLLVKIYLWCLSSLSNAVIVQNSGDYDRINHKRKYIAHGSGIPESFLLEGWEKPKKKKLEIAFVGRAEKQKGINKFLDIAVLFPSINFYIYSKLHSSIKAELQNKKPQNVTLAGFMSPKEIYKRTDAIIFPSNYGEGVARVILEALASNTYVISTSISGNIDLVNKFDMKMDLIPVMSSIEHYRQAVENLMRLNNSELLSILHSNKKNAERLSVKEIAKVYKVVRQELHGY